MTTLILLDRLTDFTRDAVKDLLLPIPYNERILNPEGLYQNPGYGVE